MKFRSVNNCTYKERQILSHSQCLTNTPDNEETTNNFSKAYDTSVCSSQFTQFLN